MFQTSHSKEQSEIPKQSHKKTIANVKFWFLKGLSVLLLLLLLLLLTCHFLNGPKPGWDSQTPKNLQDQIVNPPFWWSRWKSYIWIWNLPMPLGGEIRWAKWLWWLESLDHQMRANWGQYRAIQPISSRYMVVQFYRVLPKKYPHFPFELHMKTLLWLDIRPLYEGIGVPTQRTSWFDVCPSWCWRPVPSPFLLAQATRISKSSTELEWRGKNLKTYCWWKKSCTTWMYKTL